MEYQGLNHHEVKERQKKGYINITDENISKTKKQIIFEHTFTYFNFLNIFLAIIIIFTGNIKNLTFIGVVFTNTIVGIIQEFRVKKVIDELVVVTVKKVKVIRDSKLLEIPVEELVIDDIIFVENGNQIGSDCVVLSSQGIEANEAMLTGESDAIKKQKGDELLAGSFLVSGSGYAKVIRVGKDNYATHLAHKAKHKHRASSEMKTAIEKIIKVLSIVIIPVGLILFYAQTRTSQSLNEAIVHTVGGVIGMIPEGLVLLTSLSFIIGVGKLAKKKALIQEMEAIEALARVDVLCLDKTGTITTGDLKVEEVKCFNDYDQDYIYKIMGMIAHAFDDVNATQKALLSYFPKEDFKTLSLIPFSSERKYRAVEFKNEGAFVLGAPEFLLNDKSLLQEVEMYSKKGLRVLLLGRIKLLDEQQNKIGGLTPLAFIIIKDCIREEAIPTLKFFNKQEVDIKILSGDNPLTVSQVALQAGVKCADKYIDASTLPNDEEELRNVVEYYTVFGRVKPEQKQLIVKALQKNDHIVSMVGDGVNDVLALKDSDCGIAMAQGSEAARQAAHVVLLDSNFASMKQIVEEGRSIIANIERVSSLYLTKTIYSTLLCVSFVFLNSSYPFTPLQLSLISSLAIGIPSFYLTLEKSSLLDTDGFLHHVIKTALPCALTQVIYIIFIRFLGLLLNFDEMMFSTYYFLTAGFISFIVVFIVCLPYNRRRFLLATLLTLTFYIILLVIPSFFNIYPIYSLKVIWVIPLCASSLFVIGLLKYTFHQIAKKIKLSQFKITAIFNRK